MEIPDVSYARSGDVAVAYQAVGDGPSDLVFLPFLSNLYSLWLLPAFAAFARSLGEGRRLVLVNTRGMGLSDRPRALTIESRMDDVRAVMDALEIERAALLGWSETAGTCAVFGATYPERTDRLVLYTPFARGTRTDDYPWGSDREEALAGIARTREQWGDRAYLEQLAASLNPQWADDPGYLEWFVWNHRLSSSPGSAAAFWRMQLETDIADVLPAIRVPTLVLTKEQLRQESAWIAERIPKASLAVLAGEGMAVQEDPLAADVIDSFLRGEEPADVPTSVLATVLFTDIVGSTERAAALGDRAWRELLERHHALVRRELARYRGLELDSAGDGFFASFDGPARAIACARSVADSMPPLGLEVRAGIHTGECERVGEKLAGLAVNVGARVAAQAGPGEVVVSGTVRDLVAGSGLAFDDLGERELKGLPGRWRLHRVVR
ncbi:MAG TPA: adenylate/guanylate cyclase domain-containing protein [Gaiellaceae bacterium]|nr:adenylate/guanylate cyclase domain-containing protein [Gaiellaceae bacterium]